MRYLGISKTYYATCVKKRNMDLHELMNYFKNVNSFRKRRDYFYDKYKKVVDEYYLDDIWDKYVTAELKRIEEKEFNQWLINQAKEKAKKYTSKQQ